VDAGYNWLQLATSALEDWERPSPGSAFGPTERANGRFVAVVATVARGWECVKNRVRGSKAGYIGYNGNRRDRCDRVEGSMASQNRAVRISLSCRSQELLGCDRLSAICEADAREM
jgi:hypothetical protein